ncbi:unnamed protein product [Prunus brigantina]
MTLMWYERDEKYLSGFPMASWFPSKGWAPFVSWASNGRRPLRFILGVGANHWIGRATMLYFGQLGLAGETVANEPIIKEDEANEGVADKAKANAIKQVAKANE